MSFAKPFLAILLSFAIALPGFAQTPELSGGTHNFFSWITDNYVGHPLPRASFEDSPRLEKLMRAGAIYLSLRDAVALALENNLDLEYARYNPKLAEANLKRVSAGALLRNVSTSITSGPASATLGVLGGSALGSAGTTSSSSSGSGQGGVLSGLSVQLAGTTVPNLDPVLFLSGTFNHNTTIETATNITGTNFLVSQYKSYIYGAQEGFLTGTQVTAYMSNTIGVTQNSPYNMFNPYNQASLNLSVSQNLLQGFRPSINNRYIRVAKNSLRISDLTFKNQVMATVASVVSLYWDLVSDIEAFKVYQQTLDLDTRQYNDNKRKADLGAIAPIDIIQAEAEMKASQQDVTTSRAQVLNQEMIIKNYLTRGAMDNLAVVEAHIVPTDHFDVPEREIVRPIQDLITEAMANRPDVEQSQIGLENSRITTLGVKDAMLPVLAVTAGASNGGLAGQLNTVPGPGGVPEYTAGTANQYFQGGFGTVLGQIFGRNFPNYSAGISLTMTLRNRSTQADLITDQLNYRQQQIQDRQLHNSIKQNVVNARTSLEQARSAYETAVEARKLQEQVLQGSRRKYELGTATILDVIIAQRDATTRELSEVNARNQTWFVSRWATTGGSLPLICLLDARPDVGGANAERWTVLSVLDDRTTAFHTPEHPSRWRDWLQWANVLQFLEGPGRQAVIATATGGGRVAAEDLDGVPRRSGAAPTPAIRPELIEANLPANFTEELDLILDDAARKLTEEVLRGGGPVPTAGWEPEEGMDEGWTLEVAWPGARVAILANAIEDRDRWLATAGWDARPAAEWTAPELLRVLKERA